MRWGVPVVRFRVGGELARFEVELTLPEVCVLLLVEGGAVVWLRWLS